MWTYSIKLQQRVFPVIMRFVFSNRLAEMDGKYVKETNSQSLFVYFTC